MAKNALFACSDEPLNIFQDDALENATPMTSHAPMPTVTKPMRRPLGATDSNVLLQPHQGLQNATSPHKSHSGTALQPFPGKKLNRVVMAPPGQGQHTDSLQKKPKLSNFKTGYQKAAHDVMAQWGNENFPVQFFNSSANMSTPSVGNPVLNFNGKRGLMEPAPISKDARASKKVKVEDGTKELIQLPPHDSFPPIVDDGQKPPHSYAQLIGMALLRSPTRKLTLAQIYKWISDNYSFYNPNDAGWQNSIRHNLSLHRNFLKIERPKDDPGKGHYWSIEPGTEAQFLKEKPARKSAPSAENLPVMSTRLEPSRPATVPTSEPTLPPPAPVFHYQNQQPQTQLRQMPSSDATIPEGDNTTILEEPAEKQPDLDSALDINLYSPAPPAMNSSPPVARKTHAIEETPNMGRSSVARPRKRVGVDDSGYISSLDSSALRPGDRTSQWASGSSRPRRRRQNDSSGRAEVEIAKLRGSSPYGNSPTRGRSKSVFQPASSSPLRQATHATGPMTPRMKMKPPVQHPPSVSPNTNLRNHRNHVQSMLKTPVLRTLQEQLAVNNFTPHFDPDPSVEFLNTEFNLDTTFDEVSVENHWEYMGALEASPLKQSGQRMRPSRSVSALELPTSTRKSFTSAPAVAAPNFSPLPLLETPSKILEEVSPLPKLFQQSPLRNSSPSKYLDALTDDPSANENWDELLLEHVQDENIAPVDEDDLRESDTDFDILQGFQKIGSQSNNSKPPLGRSYSTNF